MEIYLEKVINLLDRGDLDQIKSVLRDAESNLNSQESMCFFSSCNALIYSYLKKENREAYLEVFNENCKVLRENKLCPKMINSYLDKNNFVIHCENQDILKAMDFIDQNLNRDLSLEEVANQIHLSKNYFGNLFKKSTGLRFTQYVNKRRIQKSKTLLSSTRWPIDIIAQKCGYNSQSHFSTTFSNIVGTSPGFYRSQTRKKQCGE